MILMIIEEDTKDEIAASIIGNNPTLQDIKGRLLFPLLLSIGHTREEITEEFGEEEINNANTNSRQS